MERQITVTPTVGSLVGYCNGCNDARGQGTVPVWDVHLGTLSFRVCRECRNEMIDKLRS